MYPPFHPRESKALASKETIPLYDDFDGLSGAAALGTPVAESFQAGTLVGSLRIMRPLGTGGMGAVWVARDESLGRRVALKVLHPSTAHLGDLLLREAQTTAHFSHPHIVQVYGTGIHRGAVWLSLELIDGGALRQRLSGGPLAALEGTRLLRGVADALAHAHEAGVVHQDLKPENVLIGTDGRARVADFGLARRIVLPTTDAASKTISSFDLSSLPVGPVCGTPPYMAPEQFQGAPPAPAADVWAFGVLLWETLRNDRPFDMASESVAAIAQRVISLTEAPEPHDLPPMLADLVQRCLSPDPSQRPTARELCSLLDRFLHPKEINQDGPPFRGLTRFTESGAPGFYGRESEVALLVEQLRSQPILPLVGPSGTGKSSLVLGGLVPRLRERGAIWLIEVRPGRDPFGMLAAALRRHPSQTSQLRGLPTGGHPSSTDGREARASATSLRADPFLLGRLLRTQASQLGRTAVLFVDQLEELLTISDSETQLAYLRSIVFAADDLVDPVRIILTLRDDFLGRLALDAEIRRGLSRVCVVQPPGPAGLRRILEVPVTARGFRWEDDAMVDRLVAETGGMTASLPLLQVAGSLLWARRDTHRRVIPQAALDEIGGLHGALANHADAVLSGVSAGDHAIQRRLLLRLVTPDETRAVMPLSQLKDSVGAGVDEVLERLVTHRLVNVRRAAGGDTEVELVHEALITHWHQLRRWLDEGRSDHRLASDLEASAQRWERENESTDLCLAGPRLREALVARSARSLQLSPLASRFVDCSAAYARDRTRIRRLATTGVVVLMALLMVALVGALWQREERLRVQRELVASEHDRLETARRDRDSATAALLAMRASSDSAERRNGNALVRAVAGLSLAREANSPSLVARLWEEVLLARERFLPMFHIPPSNQTASSVAYTAWAPGGDRIATSVKETGLVEIVDLKTGQTLATHARCRSPWSGGAWSTDGTRLAHQCVDSFGVQIMDASGELLQELPCGPTGTRPGDGRGMVQWWGGQLFVGAVDGICVFEGTPLQQTRVLKLEGEVTRLDANEHWVAAGLGNASDSAVATRVWDRETGKLVLELPGAPSFLRQLQVNGRFLLRRFSGSFEQLDVWTLDGTPQEVLHLEQADGRQEGNASFDANAAQLIAMWNGKLRKWTTSDWTEVSGFPLAPTDRPTPTVSPDGRFVVESTWSGQLRVIDASSGAVLFNDTSLTTRIRPLGFIDSHRLLTLNSQQGTVVWDLSKLPSTIIPRPPRLAEERLAGQRYWWLTSDGQLQTGTAAGEPAAVLGQFSHATPPSFVVSSDALSIVVSGDQWTAWRANLHEPVWARPAIPNLVGMQLSPDGSFISARTRDGVLVVLDKGGNEVMRKSFVASGNVVLHGQNYGTVDPAFTTARWAPDSSAVIAEHLNSGERWRCTRDDGWICRQWPHLIRQSTMTFSTDGQQLYDRLIDHETERDHIRRLDPQTGAVQWTWTDPRFKTHVAGMVSGTNRTVVMTRAGRMFVLTADGELEHATSLHSDDRTSLSLSFLDTNQRVAIAGNGQQQTMWIWDLKEHRIVSTWAGVVGGDWTYQVARGTHAQLWAKVSDRALIPMDAPPSSDADQLIGEVLAQTNLRICRDTLDVVSVVPFPDATSPWAHQSFCESPDAH